MKLSVLSLSALVTLALTAVACDDHDHGAEAFPTFQECYDDHHTVEALPPAEAITICCLEHPIGGVTQVCGTTATACEAYLGTNLTTASATPAEVTAGCADYITQRGQ